MHFWTCGYQKTWLDKCLKILVSDDTLTRNMVIGPKVCWNLNDSTFTIFIDYCKCNPVWKSLSEKYAKFKNYLLTHWLAMTSVLFLIETIYRNIFRCNFLKKKIFLDFFLHFPYLCSILNIFMKKLTLITDELTEFEKRG